MCFVLTGTAKFSAPEDDRVDRHRDCTKYPSDNIHRGRSIEAWISLAEEKKERCAAEQHQRGPAKCSRASRDLLFAFFFTRIQDMHDERNPPKIFSTIVLRDISIEEMAQTCFLQLPVDLA